MPELGIDLETFSEADIKTVGSYRYIDDPSFEILLFGYAWDDEPVKVIDLTAGEQIPDEVMAALPDPDVTKTAWNCAFERIALEDYTGLYLPPEQWQDTMILSAVCGLPMGLGPAGKALGLPEDAAKDKDGKALIKYFCSPCRATKANGGRTRNLPEHDPEKWQRFIEYNRQDVVAERNIRRLLQRWTPDETEHRFWCLDQKINERGMRVDLTMAEHAIAFDARYKGELTEQAIALTGMENPNSVAQIKTWLQEQEGIAVPSLNKKAVADVVAQLSTDKAKEFMAIRSRLAKSSTKKYEAMTRSTCSDGCAKGMFQFYGANRTGRFCLTGDHEVLTPAGWVRLDEWHGGRIAVWTPQGEYYSFQNAEALSFPYTGEMVQIQAQRCQQISTPDHKMPTKNKQGKWEPRTMAEIGGRRFDMAFIGKRVKRYARDPDALRILIMVQADGCYTPEGEITLGFKKARKVERCKHLLRRAGIPYQSDVFKDGVTRFRIAQEQQPTWLRQFRGKTFGWWMLDEDPDVIVEELELWDGYRCGPNSIQYTTTNRQNAEVIQAVCQLGGYSATMLTKIRSKEHPNWSDAYILNIWLTPGPHTSVRREQQSTTSFSGQVYCASTPTGYFMVRRNGVVWVTGNSGRNIQLQNLPQNHMPDLDVARQLVREGDYDTAVQLYDAISPMLSELIRTALIPEPGCQFLVADFSAIEARVLAWLCGEQWRLDTFAAGGDIYCASASQMFKVPVVKHGENGHLRQKGKVAELALGYGGGVNALLAFGADKMGMTNEEMVQTVDLWREASPNVCKLWKTLERAALKCVVRHVPTQDPISKTRFDMENGILWMTLPSGRRIAYFGAEYRESRFHPDRKCLTYMGTDQKTKKWTRLETWGGKLVENCWAAGTPVLTGGGWKPIEEVLPHELVFDGVGWVECGGAVLRGERDTIGVNGRRVTPDHLILTKVGWKRAEETDGLDRAEIRNPDRAWALRTERLARKMALDRTVRLRAYPRHGRTGSEEKEILWLPKGAANFRKPENSRNDQAPSLRRMAQHGPALHRTDASSVEELRRPWHRRLRALATQLRKLLGGYGPFLRDGSRSGPTGQRGRLLPGELPVGSEKGQLPEQTKQPICGNKPWEDDGGRAIGENWDRSYYAPVQAEPRRIGRLAVDHTRRHEPVYDLLDCGPRHSFVIACNDGPLIVHNCTQATARDCLREAMLALDAAGYDIRAHVHDEVIISEPIGGRSYQSVAEIMGQPIPWAPGLPLRADGYACPYYMKD